MTRLLPLFLVLSCFGCTPADPKTDTGPTDTSSDDTADTDTTDACTVEDVCGAVFGLCGNQMGWADQQECNDHFLGDPEYGTVCTDEAGYLQCVCPCLEAADCGAFGTCESDCWANHCL